MKIVERIQQSICEEMIAFEEKFKESMITKVPLLNRIAYYIVRRKGKQIRPMLVFLVAKMVSDGDFKEQTYRGANIIELIHTATLIHDDVVDGSNKRRFFFSISALWKNKIAVLVGDYLLSKGLILSIDNGDFDILKLISVAVKEMSEGELLQIEKTRLLDLTEDVYFGIIRQKTGALMAACCAIGASSVGARKEEVEKMSLLGANIGVAFQIKDDLFDYSEKKMGKPIGIDIKERKMTLPLIYTLNHCDKAERKWIINSVKNHNKDKKRVRELIDFVKKSGGIDYAVDKMNVYKDKAASILETYRDSPYKSSLQIMIDYVINRKK